jgi:hypothetical protein
VTEDGLFGSESADFDLDLLLPSFNPRIPPESELLPDPPSDGDDHSWDDTGYDTD